jgi:hypothetical protein
MDINTGAQQDYPAAKFNEKVCLQVWRGGDALGASPMVLSMRLCENISHVQV